MSDLVLMVELWRVEYGEAIELNGRVHKSQQENHDGGS